MESAVYVNGQPACTNCFGYNPFTADISLLLTDGMNTIAVFVRSNQPNSRWYSGSGIIRPVTLWTMLDTPVRMSHLRVTTPKLNDDLTDGETCITLDAVNTADTVADCTFTLALYAPDGRLVSSAGKTLLLAPGEDTAVSLTAAFMNPVLWNIGSGILYEAQVTARMNGQAVRSVRVPYGYRSIRFDKSAGFFLNGVHTKLKGVCLHHDDGCIGAAENRSVIEQRIDLLQSMGCNAVRLAHNPFGETFLDVCQRKGMMVVEELFNGWGKAKSANDFARYFDAHYSEVITDVIRRDWNNPAVILWSLGNEMNSGTVNGTYSSEEICAICTALSTAVKSLDTTRPTTLGNNNAYSDLAPLLSLVDVVGINYTGNDQSFQTDRAIYGSETTCALSSRGVYQTDSDRMVYTAYDTAAVSWGAPAAETVNEFLASSRSCGHFVWAGFDCIGEPSEWNRYPAKSSYFGIIDTCGFPKDIYYMYKSMWQDAPMIHILPHWTHVSGNVEVWLYSNCASVALYLNGTLLGRKALADRGTKNQYTYTVAYTPGTLVANGYDASGNLIAQDVQYTAGSAAQLLLRCDHDAVSIHSDDLVCITCDVADKNGTPCPNAANEITFTVSGGTVVGTDNGYGACTEPYRSATRSAFSGKCLCVVRPDGHCGTMSVIASSDGLTTAVCRIVKGSATIKAAPEVSSFIDAENPPKREVE
jgi:beta-galactosidase